MRRLLLRATLGVALSTCLSTGFAAAQNAHPPPRTVVSVPPQAIPGSRQARFSLYADIANGRFTRLYIYDIKLGKFVDRYLISPGSSRYPTAGNQFRITRAIILPTWTPPHSAWAANMQPVGPGEHNPMGLLKMDLGAYSQYIHGIPRGEVPALGTAASHGCMRISNPNVLHLYQNYAGVGTQVFVNRDLAKSGQWATAYKAAGLVDHNVSDGQELKAIALSGKYPTVKEYHD